MWAQVGLSLQAQWGPDHEDGCEGHDVAIGGDNEDPVGYIRVLIMRIITNLTTILLNDDHIREAIPRQLCSFFEHRSNVANILLF